VLIVAEVPEVAEGMDTVVTGLTTTSRRDAFQLQISIPIPKAAACGNSPSRAPLPGNAIAPPEPTSCSW